MLWFKKIVSPALLIAPVLIGAMSFMSPKKKLSDKSKLVIYFEDYVGSEKMLLDTEIYKNEFGQKYSVSKFKYYISNIHLKKKNGGEFISKNYFLVNEEEPDSKQIVLNNIPDGEYTSVNFILGVDSIRNCSGVQTGALDPMNGMFWAWNTGYIFLKLEGHSPESASESHLFEFHIGGYKEPSNCIRKFNLNFQNKSILVNKDKNSSLTIKTDASEILKTPTAIDFTKTYSVSDAIHSPAIADNYSDMFSVLKIE